LSAHPHELPSKLKLAGIELDLSARTCIMGVLNVTPDSFSDGGRFIDPAKALAHAEEMVEAGADIIDVGGESTRPGSEFVPLEVELGRVVPVIEGLVSLGTPVALSIDTWKSEVAERALDLGVHAVNDISALNFDTRIADLAAAYDAGIVLSHIKGTPKDMQVDPTYDDVVMEIGEFLGGAAARALSSGVKRDSIVVDPGIGFGKKLEHNLEILKRLGDLRELGYPVLIGPSRKSFIGTLTNAPVDDRVEGTLAAVALGVANGASIVRVHDVKETRRALALADAIVRA
jgi:dihydropteroate synthase